MKVNVGDWLILGDPIPIPKNKKGPPPEGTTGRAGVHEIPDPEKVQRHVDAGGNWALVLHFDFIVIDVDSHRNDAAGRVAKQMLKDYNFPKTLHVSSRFEDYPISGHYWFRVPEDHDWEEVDLRGVVSNHGIAWGEVRHHYLSYVMMPGSKNPDSESTYEYRNKPPNLDDIPEIPAALYRALIRQVPEVVEVKDGKASQHDMDKLRVQAKWSMWEFRMAQEGTRDDRHYRACMDIGGLAAVGVPQREINEMIKLINLYGKLNKADRETMAKTKTHVKRGMLEPKILYRPGDSWWFSRPSLEHLYNRALLNLDSPWATLLTELVLLSAATDHRVLLDPWTIDDPTPLAVWVGIVDSSGAGKSRIYRRALNWVHDLPELVEPPKPEAARYGGPVPEEHSEESIAAAVKPLARVSNPQTGPGLLRCYTGKVEGNVEAKIAYRLLCHYDEPDDLFRPTAQDNYLLSMLRTSFYSGGTDPMTGRGDGQFKLDPNTYSLNLLVNIQPYIMRRFRAMARDGTFQRLILCETGVDVNAAKSMRNDTIEYNIDRKDVYPWNPKGKVVGGYELEKKALVRVDAKARDELENMTYWGEGDSDSEYPSELVEEWRSMCPTGVSEEALSHLDVKLQRLTVLLARHDGVEMENGVVEVPYKYFQDAKEIMKHSAGVVSRTTEQDYRETVEEKNKERREHISLAVDTREAVMTVEMKGPERWLIDRLRSKGGKDTWKSIYNAAKRHSWFTGADGFKAMIDDINDVMFDEAKKEIRLLNE